MSRKKSKSVISNRTQKSNKSQGNQSLKTSKSAKKSKKSRKRKSQNQKEELWAFFKKLDGRNPKRLQILDLASRLDLKE